MADKRINITLGSKFNGSGFSAAMKSIRDLTRGATDIKTAFDVGLGAVTRAFGALKTVIGSAFKFETQTTQFKTLIGDIDEAKAHMADLKALGDTPPFDLDQFAAASRSLMVMTDGVLGYKKSLEMIGDAAAATGKPIEEMSHAVGRLFATIRDGQPLSRATMQLRNMGVITPEVAAKLDEMQKAGKSTAEIWAEVEQALAKYNGAMKETEQTGNGLISAIKSRWESIVRSVGQAFEDTAKDGLGEVLDAAKRLEEDGSVQTWAEESLAWLKQFSEGAITVLKPVANFVGDIWKAFSTAWDSIGQSVGNYVGTRQGGGGIIDALKSGASGFKQAWVEGYDLDGQQAERVERRKAEIREKNAKREAAEKERAAQEEAKKAEALAEGQRKIDERNAAAAAAEREKAAKKAQEEEVKAAQAAAKEREKLERELHQQRMADLRAELAAQKEAASTLQATATAAQSEFDRAFALYRDPQAAAEQRAEEESYRADLDRLHKDASRYGGKWRIDELSALMAAGDTQGVSDTLAGWRKSRSFTPEVEAMVRASAAEKTKTTAEDELRKLNDQTAGLTQKMEDLAKERDTRLDGIEHNTNQLANKIDELLSVKG